MKPGLPVVFVGEPLERGQEFAFLPIMEGMVPY